MGDRAARFQRTVLRCGLLFFTLWLTGCLLIGVARLARQHDPSQLDITYRFEAYRYSDSSLWETDDLEYGEWPQLEYYIDDGQLVYLDDGTEQWRLEVAANSVLVSSDFGDRQFRVMQRDSDKELTSLSAVSSDGELLWTTPLGGQYDYPQEASVCVGADGFALVLLNDGDIQPVAPDGRLLPVPAASMSIHDSLLVRNRCIITPVGDRLAYYDLHMRELHSWHSPTGRIDSVHYQGPVIIANDGDGHYWGLNMQLEELFSFSADPAFSKLLHVYSMGDCTAILLGKEHGLQLGYGELWMFDSSGRHSWTITAPRLKLPHNFDYSFGPWDSYTWREGDDLLENPPLADLLVPGWDDGSMLIQSRDGLACIGADTSLRWQLPLVGIDSLLQPSGIPLPDDNLILRGVQFEVFGFNPQVSDPLLAVSPAGELLWYDDIAKDSEAFVGTSYCAWIHSSGLLQVMQDGRLLEPRLPIGSTGFSCQEWEGELLVHQYTPCNSPLNYFMELMQHRPHSGSNQLCILHRVVNLSGEELHRGRLPFLSVDSAVHAGGGVPASVSAATIPAWARSRSMLSLAGFGKALGTGGPHKGFARCEFLLEER
ncbi:MAG: hypothetical protein H7A35_08115 [Planctomycetales bacterium]|nr:hypothetical protein [bacterium]UNM06851.1 MAG: hypothetical protein H7A35_08115 [Planctomycetales bacterium]